MKKIICSLFVLTSIIACDVPQPTYPTKSNQTIDEYLAEVKNRPTVAQKHKEQECLPNAKYILVEILSQENIKQLMIFGIMTLLFGRQIIKF